MSGLSGKAFDRAYLQHMASGHEQAIAIFSKEATRGRDPSLKDYAAKELPMLESHEDIVRFDIQHPER